MKINVVTLCSGYGAQEMALDRLKRDYPEFDWELLAWAEIEPNAIKAHQACHPEYADRNIGDITICDYSKITQPVDLLVYSTPCQSVSVAGQNKGMEEGTDAASALIWHTRRAIETLKPKVCVLENVKGMIMGKNVKEFHKWQNVMESYGYTNFAKVLNSKDFGVPQNRERLFMISILDCTKSYHFPEPFKLEKRIKDILEPYGTVDESFYFSPEQLLRIIAHCDRKVDEGCGFKTQFHTEDEISGCVTTRYGQRETDPCIKEGTDRIIKLGNYTPRGTHAGTLVSVEGIAPTVMGQHGTVTGVVEPCILTPQRTEEAKELRRKGIEVFGHRELVPREDGVSNTITTVQKDNMLVEPAIIQRPHGFNDGGLFSEYSPTITTSAWEANNLLKEPCILGYTRDDKGKVVDYHDKDVANTVHTSTGSGGNTDQFVKEPIDRQSRIRSKVMPNGNIRFYQDDESKSGISEMQIIHPGNECPTITTSHVPKILEPVAVAMRGRNPDNPSDRSKGCPTKQTLEFGDNIANCITTVQKDSMVAEPMVGNDPRRIFGQDDFKTDVCPALMAVDYKAPKLVKEPIELSFANLPDKTVLKDEDGKGYLWQDGSLWRVRKLTGWEVMRLMDVADEDYCKMKEAGISKTAIYSLAGNSIVVAVLYHIFRKLWIDTECESAQKSLFDF